MKELITQITSALNVDESQAKGGVGALFKMAQDNLGGTDFSKLTSLVPGIEGMLSAAPQGAAQDSETAGVAGMLGSAISALTGNSSVAGLASLAGSFKSLGLDASMVMKFAPLVLGFVKDHGGDVAQTLLKKAING